MVLFLYNLYIFVEIKHGCLTNTVSAGNPKNSVIKGLGCIWVSCRKMYLETLVLKDLDKPACNRPHWSSG